MCSRARLAADVRLRQCGVALHRPRVAVTVRFSLVALVLARREISQDSIAYELRLDKFPVQQMKGCHLFLHRVIAALLTCPTDAACHLEKSTHSLLSFRAFSGGAMLACGELDHVEKGRR